MATRRIDLAQSLAEALDPVKLAEAMSLADKLTVEEIAALRDPAQLRAAYERTDGPLAPGTVAGAVASVWHAQYGQEAKARAAYERAYREHTPKWQAPAVDGGQMVRQLTIAWLQATAKWEEETTEGNKRAAQAAEETNDDGSDDVDTTRS
jgi:hypothetical protein